MYRIFYLWTDVIRNVKKYDSLLLNIHCIVPFTLLINESISSQIKRKKELMFRTNVELFFHQKYNLIIWKYFDGNYMGIQNGECTIGIPKFLITFVVFEFGFNALNWAKFQPLKCKDLFLIE